MATCVHCGGVLSLDSAGVTRCWCNHPPPGFAAGVATDAIDPAAALRGVTTLTFAEGTGFVTTTPPANHRIEPSPEVVAVWNALASSDRTLLQRLALAVLMGDWAAALALVDRVQEEWGK